MILPNGFTVENKSHDRKQRDASDENGRHEQQREFHFVYTQTKRKRVAATKMCRY